MQRETVYDPTTAIMERSKLLERDREWLKEEIVLDKDPEKKRAYIIFNRPEKLNTLVDSHYAYLAQLMSELDWDDDVKVIVFKGAGRCFGAGHDIGALGTRHGIDTTGKGRRPNQRQRVLVDRGGGILGHFAGSQYIFDSVKTTIAQVHSYCYGFHFEVAMACDMVVATEDARFTHPGFRYIGPATELGLFYQVIPPKVLAEMVLTGRAITAQEAFQYGVINRVVSYDELEKEVDKLAEAAAALPFDGIVIGKALLQGVKEAAGVRMGNYIGLLGHALQTGIHYEQGEYNLLKSRRNKGVTEAITEREGHWARDFDLR